MQALELPATDRARLAHKLLESLDTLSDAERAQALWDREIEARVAAYDRGKTQTYAAEDVCAEARRRSSPTSLHSPS